MKGKAKLLSLLMAVPMLVLLVVGAVGVVVTTQEASAQASLLEVEITAPADSSEIDVCQNFEVRATITNNEMVTATDVTANISYDATVVEWVAGNGSSYPHEQSLGGIDPGCAMEVAWTLHCRNAGVTPITVTADAVNAEPVSDQISVFQMIKVEIIQPDPDCAGFEACPGQTFTVKAEVTNTGVDTVNVTGVVLLAFDADIITGPSPDPEPDGILLAPGQSQTFTWMLHCDALGDDIIKVEVYKDQDVLIGYDEYAFHQRGLMVDIVMPKPDEVFCASNDFYVNAVVTNTCNDIIYGVNATISGVDPYNMGSEFNAELENANETFLKQIGDIPGKLSRDLMWKLHCKGVGPVTITVDVDGETVFVEEVSHSDSVTVYQDRVLAIEINSPVGAEIYCASQHFDLTFTIHNRCEVVAFNVAATIDPGATAEVDGKGQGVSWTTPILGNIPGGQTIGPFTYDMHCTGTGDSTITVDATAANLIDEQIVGDSVTVTQAAEEVTLEVEIVNPMTSDEFCTHCYNEFTVDATISNPACAAVENALAELHYSCGPGDVSILDLQTQPLGNIGGLTTTTVSWDVACTGAGDVTFWVEAWAENVDQVDSINNVTIHQKDFIVEITDVGGIDSAPLELPTCQAFTITARFINCHETTQLVNIQAILDFSDIGAVPMLGSMVHIKYCSTGEGCDQAVCEETKEVDVPVEDTLVDVPPFRSVVTLERICPCCCAEVTWTLQCVNAISGEFTVTALTSGGVFLAEASTPQILAFITTSADAIGVCQDFSVVAIVTNIGKATAANVEVTIDVTGNASPSGTLTQTVDANIPEVAPGTIPGGQSGKAMWELHCDGPGEVWIEIVELTGMDVNTGNPILLENIEIPMAKSVSQVLAVEIVQPVTSTEITACSEIAVEALVTNIGDIDLVDVVASMTLTDYPEGTEPATRAELIDGEPPYPGTKGLGTIPTGITRDVGWVVHCLSSGDVAIRVTARSGGLYAVSAPVIVHQVAAEIGVGGGGGGITYFTVDFQGKITKEPMSSDGRLLNPLEAPSPDGMHLLEMAKGTKTVDDKGKIVTLIEIREAEAPSLPANTVIAGNAYNFEPSNITFNQPIRLTLGYDVNNLPKDAASVALAYYTAMTGWTELKTEGGVGVGKLTAPVDHFTIFAILAKLTPPPPAPAAFKVSNLQITPSQFRIWEPVTFVVKIGEEVAISAYVTNYGGQEGKYTAILKVNGATQATKEIILGSGQGQQIGFTLTENEPGRYTVDIGGLSGEFVTSLWTNWWLIGGILAALILIGWLAWYYWYYRRRQEGT